MLAPGRHARRVPRHKRDLPRWIAWPAVVVLTGASLGLGFFDLTKKSLWLDEGYSWLNSDQSLSTISHIARQDGWHLIPYYLVVHSMISLFGDSVFVLRAPSVVAAGLTVPLLYLLVSRLGGRLAGVYAGLLFVVSEPLVYWQQNARDYTFVVLFAVGSVLAEVVGLQTQKIWPFVVWVIVTGAGCYTHPEMLFVVPPELLVWFFWGTKRTRIILGVFAGAGALLSLPVIGQATHGAVYQVSFLNGPNHESATEIASFLASAAGTAAPVTAADHALLGITFGIAVIGVALLGSDFVENGCRSENLGLALTLAWLVMPVLASWLGSETGHPSFLDRYVIVSLPAASAVVALVAVRIEPRALGAFAVVYMTIFRGGLVVHAYHYQIDDYRAATAYVLSETRPGDCITFSSDGGRMLYDYYSAGHRRAPLQELPPASNGPPKVVAAFQNFPVDVYTKLQSPPYVSQISSVCSRFFVMTSHLGTPSGSPSYRQTFSSYMQLETSLATDYRKVGGQAFTNVTMEVWNRVHVAGKA